MAAETLVEGVDNAGIPDTPQGEEAAERVSDWADSAQDELEEAQDSLDEEADTLEESIEQLTDAAGAIGTVLASGVQTIAEVSRLDPELAARVRRLEHLPATARGEATDEHDRLDPDRARRRSS